MTRFNVEVFKEVLKRVSGNKSNKAIAEDLFISEVKVSNWFTGRSIPTTSDLLTIANTYKCSVDELLGLNELKDDATYTFGDFIRIIHVLWKNDKIDILPVDGVYFPWDDFISMKQEPNGVSVLEVKHLNLFRDYVNPNDPIGLTEQDAEEMNLNSIDMANQFSDYVMTFKFTENTLFDIEDYHHIIKADTYHGTADRLLQAWFKTVKDKPLEDF